MDKVNRKYFIERIRRLKFVKFELLRIVENSFIRNTNNDYNTRLFSGGLKSFKNIENSQTRHRIMCPVNKSTKLVNRRYRLSRFSFNRIGNCGKIIGLMKRGW